MKKLLLIPILFLSAWSFCQRVVNNTTPGNTIGSYRNIMKKNLVIPNYDDTTQANIAGSNLNTNNIGIDSCGAIIRTRSPQTFWIRFCDPHRWVQVGSGTGVVNLDSSRTTISIIDDTHVLICNGDGVCDTITFSSVINNISSVSFVSDSSFAVCKNDTTSGVVTQICDTIIIPRAPTFAFQNWTYSPSKGIIEAGTNPLIHTTTFNTGYFQANFFGTTVYDYPVTFTQGQHFPTGTGMVSFRNVGSSSGQVDSSNSVRLGINYTGRIYPATPSNLPGYFGTTRIMYWIGTNITGNGSYGLNMDDNNSKITGISFHTKDTTNNEAVNIFGINAPYSGIFANNMDTSIIATFYTDKSTNFLGKVYLSNGRLEPDTALITAANDLALGLGNVMLVSGNTQINAIATSGWQAGSAPIYLSFTGTPTIKHNTAGGAGTAPILLAGSIDFTASVGDVLTIFYDGTNWREASRKLANAVGSGGYFQPNQTSNATTSHDAAYHEFDVINLGFTSYTSGTSGRFSQIGMDSTQTYLQTENPTYRVVSGTTIDGGTFAQMGTLNKSTNKSTVIKGFADSLVIANGTTQTVIDYTKPLIKFTRDSLILKNIPRSTDTLLLTLGTDSVVRTRGVSTISSLINANEGLIDSSGYIQLGQSSAPGASLLTDRYINAGAFILKINSTTGGINTFQVTSSGTNATAVTGTGGAYGGYFTGTSTAGVAGFSDGTFGGVYGQTSSGTAGIFRAISTSTNTSYDVLEVQNRSTGTPTAGIGSTLGFSIGTTSIGTFAVSNQLVSKFTDPTNGAVTSQLDITGQLASVTNTIMSAYGSGVVGIGISSSYTATRLNVVDNGLGSSTKMADFTSSSTGDSHTLISVNTSGANANTNQSQFGIEVSNTHTGSGGSAANYGVYSSVSGATGSTGQSGQVNNWAIYGNVDAGVGVQGQANSGVGVFGQSVSGYAVLGYGNNAGAIGVHAVNANTGTAIWGEQTGGATTGASEILRLDRDASGTATNGVAGLINLRAETDDNSSNIANQIYWGWANVVSATRTSLFKITGVAAARTDNLLVMGDSVTLTESSATTFLSTTVPSGGIGGGEVIVTITANDGTDFQSRTQRFIWTAVNKGGATTITLGTVEEVAATSTGTLTSTITAVDAGSGVINFQANAVSSLTQTTLRASYTIHKNF